MDQPAPLKHTIRAPVRFGKCDLLQIVWHGNYVTWLEDARQCLGTRIGLGYEDFVRERYACPIVDMHISYKRPARYGDFVDITAMLHWSEVPKVVHSYEIRRATDGELMTTAETVQVLLTPEGQLALNFPPFLEAFRQKWRNGELNVGSPEPTPWA